MFRCSLFLNQRLLTLRLKIYIFSIVLTVHFLYRCKNCYILNYVCMYIRSHNTFFSDNLNYMSPLKFDFALKLDALKLENAHYHIIYQTKDRIIAVLHQHDIRKRNNHQNISRYNTQKSKILQILDGNENKFNACQYYADNLNIFIFEIQMLTQ